MKWSIDRAANLQATARKLEGIRRSRLRSFGQVRVTSRYDRSFSLGPSRWYSKLFVLFNYFVFVFDILWTIDHQKFRKYLFPYSAWPIKFQRSTDTIICSTIHVMVLVLKKYYRLCQCASAILAQSPTMGFSCVNLTSDLKWVIYFLMAQTFCFIAFAHHKPQKKQ